MSHPAEQFFPGAPAQAKPELLHFQWQTGRITIEELRSYLLPVWGQCQSPHAYLSDDKWREMFDATGFTHNGQPATPPTEVVLYRAAPKEWRECWSWTTHLQVAQVFQQWHHTDTSSIWTITAPADALLAAWSNWQLPSFGATEYVADPTGLHITEFAPPPTRPAIRRWPTAGPAASLHSLGR
ncbi:hypothetical protein BH10ACT9_BH10ACT9_35500 [soil metagenome]